MKTITANDLLHTHQAEYPHSRHVTRLALQIFDAVHSCFSLNAIDRRILKAAAMLHDVGYAEAPGRHASKSVSILNAIRLKGYTPIQQELATVVISLHRRNYKSVFKKKEYLRLKHPERAIILGAILRIADGLDHSHIQDGSIKKIKRNSKNITLYCQSKWYQNNIPWALGKADLWNTYAPLPIRIVKTPPLTSTARYHGILDPTDCIPEAFRSLFGSQLRVYFDNITGSCQGADPEYLHDLRVTLRRARVLFNFFSPVLHDTRQKTHARFIRTLTASLGPHRDSQVWIEFLDDCGNDPQLRRSKQWKAFYTAEKKKDRRHIPRIRKILLDPDTLQSNTKLSLYFRSFLPEIIANDKKRDPYISFAASQLSKQLNKLLQCRLIDEGEDTEIMHDVRKRVRKTRYFAEFSETILPPVIRQLTQKLKAVADNMGNMHDLDVHAAHIAALKNPSPPRQLKKIMKQRYITCRKNYEKTWQELFDKTFQKRVHKVLKKTSQ